MGRALARHVGLKADLLVVYLTRPLSGVRVFCSLCSGYELINRRNCFCNPCRSGFHTPGTRARHVGLKADLLVVYLTRPLSGVRVFCSLCSGYELINRRNCFCNPCRSGFHTPGTRARHVGLKADLLVVYLPRPLSGVRVFCSLCSGYELINRRNCFCNPCRSGFYPPGTRARHVGLKADLLVGCLTRPLSGGRVFCSLCSGYELINRRNCFCNPCRSDFYPPGTRARRVGLKADLLVVYLTRPLSGVRVFCSLCSDYGLINRRNCFCNPCRSDFSPMCRPEGRPTGRVFAPTSLWGAGVLFAMFRLRADKSTQLFLQPL